MKRLLIAAVSALIALLIPAAAPALTGMPDIDRGELAMKIHERINAERVRAGLGALQMDTALSAISEAHSRDMAERNYFAHENPEGKNFWDRYENGRYECRRQVGTTVYSGAENISMEFVYSSVIYRGGSQEYQWKTADEIAASVVERWMKSPGHRANILTPHFLAEGIGISIDREGKVLVTEDFC